MYKNYYINIVKKQFAIIVMRITLVSLLSFSLLTLRSRAYNASVKLSISDSIQIPNIIKSTKLYSTTVNTLGQSENMEIDKEYPGTAVLRLRNSISRVKSLNEDQLNGDWEDVRRNLLWAGGLKDLPNAMPGQGYTGHSFNDFNHCDLTTMLGEVSSNENNGQVAGIHRSNQLGPGIQIASDPELGPGGSWSTCMMGCNIDPPRDVAHVQFKSRIAFKLVWVPPSFESFVLVDDSGAYLASGTPKNQLPDIREREQNYRLVKGSKYAIEADRIAKMPLKI